jgi:biopolymer transport protein ExbD
MRLDPPPRRILAEPLLPMINVVFLLLIFFLLVARMTAPQPVPVTAPQADGAAITGKVALFLGADGTLAHGDARDDGALSALSATRDQVCAAPCDTPPLLMLHVDKATSARRLALVMAQLSGLGWHDVLLVTAQP